MKQEIKIYAINTETRRRERIDKNMFWFEREEVESFDGVGTYSDYEFEIFVDDVKVFSTT